jgi:hypothetical protein
MSLPGLPHQNRILGSLQMDKQALLRALQIEIQRHDLGTLMDEPQSGRGVVCARLLAVPEAFEYEQSKLRERMMHWALVCESDAVAWSGYLRGTWM